MFFCDRQSRAEHHEDDEILEHVVAERALELRGDERPETARRVWGLGTGVWGRLIAVHSREVTQREAKVGIEKLVGGIAEIDGGVSIADIAARSVCFYTGDMKPLLTPDAHHFNAAVGWFELGNRKEARVELEYVSQENQLHPLVLELRWSLDAEDKKWDAALKTAQDIIATLPNDAAGWLHCAYALRRAKSGGLDKALAFLEPAAQQFPNEPVIAFNLACYACQLNQLDDARRWLKRASEIGGKKEMRAMALADDDLKPLWEELGKC